MKYWVFDLDGTLVDSFPHYYRTLQRIFTAHGVEFNEDLKAVSLTQMPVHFLPRYVGEANAAQALADLFESSNDDARDIQPFEGIEGVIQLLALRNQRIAVWTARELTSASLVLKHTGLDRYLERCVSGSCVVKHKPDPEGLIELIRHFDCDPSDITVVGDHENDMIGAKAVGARAVRASWHPHGPAGPKVPCSRADHEFETVADFARWVESEN